MIIPFDFSDAHYTAAARIWSSLFQQNPESPEKVRQDDQAREVKHKCARFFWQEQGENVAMAFYIQQCGNYQPDLFNIYVLVLPSHRKQGIGTALYNHLMAELVPHEPNKLLTTTIEDMLDGVRFLKRHGFRAAKRYIVSTLPVEAFDPGQFAAERERFTRSPYTIKTLRQLREADPENCLRKLHTLKKLLRADLPSSFELTEVSYEAFAKQFESPHFYPDGYFVALHDDTHIGLTNLWQNSVDPGRLITHLTGTHPDYRRQGIALVLKLNAIEFAQQIGAKTIHTDNEENNPMYTLNLKLGFVPEPAEVEFVKHLSREHRS